MIPALLVATALHAGMHQAGELAPSPARALGAAGGAVVGSVVGGAGGLVAFATLLSTAQQADNCRGEECEAYGLTAVFFTVPVVVASAVAGAAVGGVSGYLLGGLCTGDEASMTATSAENSSSR